MAADVLQLDELRKLVEEERQRKAEMKEKRRLKKLKYLRALPGETVARYRQNAKNKTEEELAAIRKYNAERQREYLKTKKLDESYRKHRNKMAAEYVRRKRLRLAGRPKPETCEICGRGGNIVFDHSHKTKKFRGWTCDRCNVALGMVEDSITVLEKLIIYLKAHSDE